MSGCECPQHPGRHITDPQRHAAWHALVVEQGGPADLVDAVTLRASRGVVGSIASSTLLDTRAIDSGKRVPGWLRRAASATTYSDWLPIFVAAVRELPIGTEFTTAYLHNKVPAPPHHNHWGKAQTHVGEIGLAVAIDVQKSELATTKGSRLLRWRRVEHTDRAVA